MEKPIKISNILEENILYLKKIQLFKSIEEDLIQELVSISTILKLKNEALIYQQGDIPSHFTFLTTGLVDLIINSKGSNPDLLFQTYESGEIFGTISIFSGLPYATRAVARGDSVVLKIRIEMMMAFFDRTPKILKNLIQLICKKNYEISQKESNSPRFYGVFADC